MRKVFVVPYFGNLPNWIQLWLYSCGKNTSFTWLLITDTTSVYDLTLPQNVLLRKCTFEEIENIFKTRLCIKINLKNAYKLCDFKPLYWILLDHYGIDYDFWGYCDLDVIFGRLDYFMPEKLFLHYDKIGTYGHLTLIKNRDDLKRAYLLEGAKFNFERVCETELTLGFDERFGINRIYKKNGFKQYDLFKYTLDILPDFHDFTLSKMPINKDFQMFIYDSGKILFIYKYFQRIIAKEYAYIHFQKRILVNNTKVNTNRFLIDADGFSPIDEVPLEINCFKRHFKLGKRKGFQDKVKKARFLLRYYKKLFIL